MEMTTALPAATRRHARSPGMPTYGEEPVSPFLRRSQDERMRRGRRRRRTLRLLQRRALGELRVQHERAEHLAQFTDAELVLNGLRLRAVDQDAERLESGAHATPDLFDGAQEAASEVGGDYYDILRLSDGRIGVAVADVAGKEES